MDLVSERFTFSSFSVYGDGRGGGQEEATPTQCAMPSAQVYKYLGESSAPMCGAHIHFRKRPLKKWDWRYLEARLATGGTL